MLSNNFVSLRFNPPEHRISGAFQPREAPELRDAVCQLVISLVTAQLGLPSDSCMVCTNLDAYRPTGTTIASCISDAHTGAELAK